VTDAEASPREGCVWRLLVGIQAAAVAAVLVAILVVWIIGHTGSDFVPR
jgi:hypothetical protein